MNSTFSPLLLTPALRERGHLRLQQLAWPETLANDEPCLAVLACSDFVFQVAQQHNEWLLMQCQNGGIHTAQRTSMLQAEFASIQQLASEDEVLRQLRYLRARHMAIIAWRDIAGMASVEETVQHLSLLADLSVQHALRWLTRDFQNRFGQALDAQGQAQELLVLAMGKLGGHELNFSSDIDLMFFYGDDGITTGPRKVEHREFFTRLGQRLIYALSQVTPNGFVFRIDMRLRPYGDSGPLTLSLDALEEYYQDQGREWERFAGVKARVITGDEAAKSRFVSMIKPFVFRRYIDYGVLEAIRRLKAMIAQDLRRKARGDNIKLGAGGIREIEFIVQAHQLIRGGREPALRSPALLPMLQQLADSALMPATEVKELREAYLYLRRLENVLQALRDEQTQLLPSDPEQQLRLAAIFGFENYALLLAKTNTCRARVHELFISVFGAPTPLTETQDSQRPAVLLWQHRMPDDEANALLQQLGFNDTAVILKLLHDFRHAPFTRAFSERGRQRFDSLMPNVIEIAARLPMEEEQHPALLALPRMMQLLQAVAKRTAYLELLAENRGVLHQLLTLFSRSAFIAEQIAHYPVLLDELIDASTLSSPPRREDMRADIQQAILRIAPDDLESLLDALRECRHAHHLRLAAATLSGRLDVSQLSERLTDLAEVMLDEVLQLSLQQLMAKHGAPTADGNCSFLITAYGKFGGQELSFSSDLDLVFLYDGDATINTVGEKPISLDQFYTRLAQRIVHCLNARTGAGILYEVDTRLRPSGKSGLLVSHIDGFEQYQLQEAWVWEHQALVRARAVAGDPLLAKRFTQFRYDVLCQQRDASRLREHVLTMRTKMREVLDHSTAQSWDLKHGAGGVVDIEFLVQYFVLRAGAQLDKALHDTHSSRLLQQLAARQLIPDDDAKTLITCYKHYREHINQRGLNAQDTRLPNDSFLSERAAVTQYWTKHIGDI